MLATPAPESAIGIICKTPIVGASKTRLARRIGDAGAAELAACFLRDVAHAIEAVPACCGRRGYAVYAPAGSEATLRQFLPADFGMVCHRSATLGDVLLGATEELLAAGHDCVILVNGDSPTLPPHTLTAAIATLRRPGDRVVLGPSSDGGYYLIGLKSPHAELFRDIPWSTEAVCATTMERATAMALDVALLPVWYDVDDDATLQILIDECCGRPLPFDVGGLRGGMAVATRAFLASHGLLAGTTGARPESTGP